MMATGSRIDIYLLLQIISLAIGGVLGYFWWQSFIKHKETRQKLLAQGVKISFWHSPWRGLDTPTGVPQSLDGRLLLFLITIVTPLACFVIAADSNFPFTSSPWQSGSHMYPEILLGRDTTPYFYPFALYGSLSALALLITPERASQYFAIRFGIYSGTALAMHFSLVLLLADGMMILPIICGAILLIPLALVTLFNNYSRETESRPFFWLTAGLLAWLLFILPNIFSLGSGVGALGSVAFFSLLGLIGYVFPVGLWLSIRLVQKEKAWTVNKTGVLLAWVTGYTVALLSAINRMFVIYNNLPTSPPPDCYIATAAAQGYPRLVGSFTTATVDGKPFRINQQLQRLKAAELILLALSPRAHRTVRNVYDVWGKLTAQKMAHPAVATCVYWSLKPVEWITSAILYLLGSEIRNKVKAFYT